MPKVIILVEYQVIGVCSIRVFEQNLINQWALVVQL